VFDPSWDHELFRRLFDKWKPLSCGYEADAFASSLWIKHLLAAAAEGAEVFRIVGYYYVSFRKKLSIITSTTQKICFYWSHPWQVTTGVDVWEFRIP
jgi:hypothetical protein